MIILLGTNYVSIQRCVVHLHKTYYVTLDGNIVSEKSHTLSNYYLLVFFIIKFYTCPI